MLRETVLALHQRLLAEFGGMNGLRDEGLLDSALARPPATPLLWQALNGPGSDPAQIKPAVALAAKPGEE